MEKLQIENGIYTEESGIWLTRESHGVLQNHHNDTK